MAKHPFVNKQLQTLAAQVGLLGPTGSDTFGGPLMPGRGLHDGLADDGYLFLDQGEILPVRIGVEFDPNSIPSGRTIASLTGREGLLVRYPVRMKEDLLPFTNLTARETVELLGEQLRKNGCQATEARILDLVDQQPRFILG